MDDMPFGKSSSLPSRATPRHRRVDFLAKSDPNEEWLLSPSKQAVIWIKKAHQGSTQWVEDCTVSQFYYYCLLKKLKWSIWIPTKYMLLLVMMFEEPARCVGSIAACSSMNKHYYSSAVSVIPLNVSAGISIVLYCIILCRINIRRLSLGTAWRFHQWGAFNLTFTILGLLGAIGYWASPMIFIATSVCRPLVFLGSSKKLRQGVRQIVAAVPGFVDVLASLFICVFLFTCVGMVLFVRTPEGVEDFSTWSSALSKMWILFTTSNSPNVYIPAFNQSRMSFMFFFFYLILTMYLLGNVLLAKVYHAYKELLKEDMLEYKRNQRHCISMAFDTLSRNQERISTEEWTQFLVEYCDPAIGGIQVQDPLDTDYNAWRANIILQVFHGIDASAGMSFSQFEKTMGVFLDRETYITKRRPPQSAAEKAEQRSMIGKVVQTFYKHGFEVGGVLLEWDKIMDFIIVIGTGFTLWLTTWFIHNRDHAMMHKRLYWVIFGFSVFYTLSITVKISSLGFERFWHRRPIQHRFDFFNVYGLIIIELLYMLVWRSEEVERLIILLSFARALRLCVYITPLKHLFYMIHRMGPIYYQMSMLLIVVFYIFISAGRLLFGGLIYDTNPALATGSFAESHYWQLNFNDTAGGWVTLFAAMVINNWYVIANGYVLSTGTLWASVFFILFFVVVNLIVLNILMALILDSVSVMSEEISAEFIEQKDNLHHDTSADLERLASGSGLCSAEKMLMKVLCTDEHFDDHYHSQQEAVDSISQTFSLGGGESSKKDLKSWRMIPNFKSGLKRGSSSPHLSPKSPFSAPDSSAYDDSFSSCSASTTQDVVRIPSAKTPRTPATERASLDDAYGTFGDFAGGRSARTPGTGRSARDFVSGP